MRDANARCAVFPPSAQLINLGLSLLVWGRPFRAISALWAGPTKMQAHHESSEQQAGKAHRHGQALSSSSDSNQPPAAGTQK